VEGDLAIIIHVFFVAFLVDLAGGLETSFFVAATLFAGGFLAAALAFVVDEVPVTDFLAAPRLEGAVVFLVVVVVLGFGLATAFLGVGFLGVGLGFSASAFLVGAFLVSEDLGLAVVAFVVLGLDVGLVEATDLGLTLEAGLFSLVAASIDLDLGASLILPESPLGRAKIPFCSPETMALDN